MLTSDLLRVIAKKGKVRPRYLDTSKASAVEKSQALTEIFEANMSSRRAEIDAAVQECIGYGTDFLIWRGLAKLLYERSEFETVSAAAPVEIRRAVFEAANELGPVTSPALRQQVLEHAASALEITPEECDEGLYADLDDNQRMTAYKKLKGSALLDRYNLALAQAVLYKATSMHIELGDQDANLLRYLFQSLKFFGLMHRIYAAPDGGWRVEVDGPASLFSKSRKYGLQMAKFLPALVCMEDWTMRAELDWVAKGPAHLLELGPDDGLVSHYQPKGQWVSDEEKMLEDRFTRVETEWILERRGTLVELDEGQVLIPNYLLTHPDGRVVFMEVIGFWRRSYLERRIEQLERLRDTNLLLVVSEKLNSDKGGLESVGASIVFFKTVIIVDKILAAIETLTSKEESPGA